MKIDLYLFPIELRLVLVNWVAEHTLQEAPSAYRNRPGRRTVSFLGILENGLDLPPCCWSCPPAESVSGTFCTYCPTLKFLTISSYCEDRIFKGQVLGYVRLLTLRGLAGDVMGLQFAELDI